MKKNCLIFIFAFHFLLVKAQTSSYAPVTDTINFATWEQAMQHTFGLLNKSHFPSGYLFNKAHPIDKLAFADGTLNDSTFNVFEFYFLQNFVRMSYDKPDSIIGYLKLDSLKNKYIEQYDVLPLGFIDIKGHMLNPNAISNGAISIINKQLVENSTNISSMYQNKRFFCVAPLNEEVNTLNPQFIIRSNEVFSNNTNIVSSLMIDVDDGLGYKQINFNIPFQANYLTDGYKIFTTMLVYSNGDTLYSRSELKVNNSNILSLLSTQFKPFNFSSVVYGNGSSYTNLLGDYPSEFTGVSYDNEQNQVYAELGIWNGCGNDIPGRIRKPYVIFGGYNPKDGKSLLAVNNYTGWFAQIAGPMGFWDGWRGPLYETYNGFFTDFSKNASGGQNFGDNGAKLLDKLTQEGYDVIIVRFHNGVGYIQTNAYLSSLVIKLVNSYILNDANNVIDAGAALDPEAPGYPNSTKIKRAKHELVVGGYSAGALCGRLALTLMEYEHDPSKRDLCGPNAYKFPHHRTKIWVGVDHECQGSNTPLGIQMFWDFQKSLYALPVNLPDLINSIICKSALDILQTRGVATQNTLYHIDETHDIGNSTWSSKPHTDFDKYFADLTNVTLPTTPANLKGYPIFPYRISISQGNANGLPQNISTETNMLFNQSPSAICITPLGTNYGAGNWLLKITPFREATARVLGGGNNEAFNCKAGMSFKSLFYSWHINYGHWKYYTNNHVNDWWLGGPAKNYDEATASSLPSNILFAEALKLSYDYPLASVTFCNLKQFPKKQAGFAPTVSGLDLHLPGNNNLPRFPNLSIVPGNTSGGLHLMQRNKYNNSFDPSPNGDFGYPHLTFPTSHYDYTPYDAIWANTTNDVNYDDNIMHVEDPNPLIGVFLTEELAPKTLYLSNRLIQDQIIHCGANDGSYSVKQKYYADFEARNSILAGNQSIYQNEADPYNPNPALWYKNQRTAQGDFVVGDGAVVTFHANNFDNQSKITLGAGFSSKHGSIFRAYLYTDPNLCSPFGEGARTIANTSPIVAKKQARPIHAKRATSVKTTTNAQQKINILLYPNPTNGELIYVLNTTETYNYTITNTLGQAVQTGVLSTNINKIDLAQLPKGVYLISIFNKDYKQTDRIILQ
ncbi:MAG: T9SS type A sorting domain-containing protein [Bacteroidetes bacterium]|mgnify:CR=1 FL=1|nr:T9SS type A sorting domain-containing protein [Bacteroidota bacterium]